MDRCQAMLSPKWGVGACKLHIMNKHPVCQLTSGLGASRPAFLAALLPLGGLAGLLVVRVSGATLESCNPKTAQRITFSTLVVAGAGYVRP